jgi:uncharacterized protein YecT (DUF1311 family)
MFLLIFMACFIMPGNQAAAVEEQPPEDWKKICERIINLPFPSEDRPGPKDSKALDNCSSYELYYGFNEEADPHRARLCAYDEMDKDSVAGPFDGKAMLMTIYANGVGARRNFDIAIKLACKVGGAPAEIEGRVEHLDKLKKQNWQGKNFSLCDDATSGYLAGFCANHADNFASMVRAEKIYRIQAKWTSADEKEYAILKKAADQYFAIRAENEVPRGGTAYSAMFIAEKASQEEAFIKTLELLEQGKFTKYSRQQFKDADSRLNTVYRKTQRKRSDPCPGSITNEEIRGAQRVWLKYRDAWVKFCAKKYSGCDADSIKTYLTLKRIKELEEFLD